MPLWLHAISLGLVFLAGAFFGSLMGVILLVPRFLPKSGELPLPNLIAIVIVTFGGFIAGAIIFRYLFETLIPARCPSCKGRAKICDYRPVTYRCQRCGSTHQTSVSFDGD